ncbi:MAG TPA: hypothetical protein VJT31_10180 [Rugosimonospora sp.]|nr:hypothetical protein [Rugosimonospora sp.]
MKRRLLRAGTAAALAIGIVLPGTAQPAQADVGSVIGIIKEIYSLYQQFAKGGSSGPTLQQAIQQIEAAIQSAQNAIISQIDRVAAAGVQACATSAVINFADINALTPDNLQAFALDTTSCVTQANSLISAVTDKAATDMLGFALNTVGPLALMARTKAGLSTPDLKTVLVGGNNTLVTALLPDCQHVDESGGEPGVPHFFLWECTAYNGDMGAAKARAASENAATQNTSRAVAQAVLPGLQS